MVRARLILSLISLSVVVILTVLGARAFIASSPTSPGSPISVARNGLAGLCANVNATAAAGGVKSGDSPVTAISPAELAQLQGSDPSALRALQQAAGRSLVCPTTTRP